MKAAYITKRPSLNDLGSKIHFDASQPAPTEKDIKPNEIIVQVKAFSINVDDIHVAEGSFLGGVPGMQRRNGKDPLVIGSDFAGLITHVGSDVKDFKVGQRVCGMNKQQSAFSERGTWAEYTVTKPKNIVAFPEAISFEEAAACVMPLFVIHGLLLENKLDLGEGEKVLVIGSSGGIGSMLVSILSKMYPKNLHITAVCSGRNEKFVKGLGAHQVVDYTKGPVEASLKDEGAVYDVVFDIVGGKQSYKTGKMVLKRNGKFITCVGPTEWLGDEILSFTRQLSLIGKLIWYSTIKNWIPGSHPHYSMAAPMHFSEAAVSKFAFENGVRPHIERSVAFDDHARVKDALELVRSHRVRGKVIVEME